MGEVFIGKSYQWLRKICMNASLNNTARLIALKINF